MALNESLQTEEITIHTVCTLLSRAERNSYIEDAEKAFEQFDLGRLGTRYCPEFSFRENLIREADRSDIYNEAKRLSAMKQFLPELDRIYAGRISLQITGHPVHYMVQTDDTDICRKTVHLLLKSLYASGRLKNRRYSTVAFETADEISRQTFDQLYKSNSGGAVIVLYRAGCSDIRHFIHGEKAHSRYFSEGAYEKLTGDNKELMIIPGANHVDLYDNLAAIPFEKLRSFFEEYLK